MITIHKFKLILGILVLLASACGYANSVSVTFVNQVNAFATNGGKSNPMLSVDQQNIISISSFSLQKNTIVMPYSGDGQLLVPGVNYYTANGPIVGPTYYQLKCGNSDGWYTTIDTRYGGSATITLLNFSFSAGLECSCTGTACGTNIMK